MNMNQINTHALREVVEDSLYSLVMWIDEAYAYDSRQLEEIPCDDVAANYLATIACCLAVSRSILEEQINNSMRFVCSECGGTFLPPVYSPMWGKGMACYSCHLKANAEITALMESTYRKEESGMYDEYEDEVEAGRMRDEERNEEFARWLKARK